MINFRVSARFFYKKLSLTIKCQFGNLFVFFVDGLKDSLEIIHVIVLKMVQTASRNLHSLLNSQIDTFVPKYLDTENNKGAMYATMMSPRLLNAGMTLLRAANP